MPPKFKKPPNPNRRRNWRIALLIAAPVLWFAGLRFGPALAGIGRTEAVPGVFKFHARGLVLAQLGYPRQLEAHLSAPAPGSNEEAQLRLMGFWTGKEWSDKARGYGRVEGRGLKLLAGRLDLVEVTSVTTARDYNGPKLCQVDYKVRWTYRDELDEFNRVKGLVPYQLPKSLGIPKPGGEASRQVTLERKALGWTVQDAEELRKREAGLANPNYRLLSLFL